MTTTQENEAKRLKLIKLRESIGLSIKDASAKFDTPYNTWWQWEKGERRVPGIAIVALETYKDTLPSPPKESKGGKSVGWFVDADDPDDPDIPFV